MNCLHCGSPTAAKTGYCRRTPGCRSRNNRVLATGTAVRLHCLVCGKETKALCGVCSACDNTVNSRFARAQVKRECFDAYGGVCACCGETRLVFLALDHVYGDGADERKKFATASNGGGNGLYSRLRKADYPDKDRYQVLCHNCNIAKGSGKSCPCLGSTGPDTLISQIPGQQRLF